MKKLFPITPEKLEALANIGLAKLEDCFFSLADELSQETSTEPSTERADEEVPDETPETLYINLVGGPCCGKSTVASGLFNLLKLEQKYSTELVNEAVKEFVYDENKQALDDQLLITAVQNHNLRRLKGKVERVITDASLLNGIVYNRFYGTVDPVMEGLVMHLFKGYNNVVFLLPRKPKYDQYGRTQSVEEAKEIDALFIQVLDEWDIPFYDMRSFTHKQLPVRIESFIN